MFGYKKKINELQKSLDRLCFEFQCLKDIRESERKIHFDHVKNLADKIVSESEKKTKQEKDFPKQTDIFDQYPKYPAVKIHKKEGTIEVPKDKFLTAEVKPKQTRTRKPKRTFSLFWGLIKFNY